MRETLLEIRGLTISFSLNREELPIVTDLDLVVHRGEVVALVGESGSGKTLTALAVAGLLPTGASTHAAGKILFEGKNLLSLNHQSLRRVRGKQISYIFQEPGTALNPVYRVGAQIREALRFGPDVKGCSDAIHKLLTDVGIEDPEWVARAYPHQLSGGQQQRVMIAMALACKPDLLIADEPTTALDVTVQAQILDLLTGLCRTRNMSVLIITHNLAIAAQLARRMYVMYAGQIVEVGASAELIKSPSHPYTRALLNAVPRLHGENVLLKGIPGAAPHGGRWPDGCRFYPRCGMGDQTCREIGSVDLSASGEARWSRCQYWERVDS